MSAALADGVLAIVKAATEPLFTRIKALESELAAMKAAPPVPGPQGPQGEKGADGVNGRDGVDGEKGQDGSNGRDGVDGRDGIDGIKGADGVNGADGKDGVGMAGAVIDRDGGLLVTLTDGATKSLGVVVGAKGDAGRDGVDGKDGVGFDDLTIEQTDDRTFQIKAAKGEQVKMLGTVTIPTLVYRGVWEAGKTYQPGDAATWGGSVWVAKEITTAKPDEHGATKAWQLAVKRGSEGKPGKQGDQGPQGVKGEKGDRGPERWA